MNWYLAGYGQQRSGLLPPGWNLRGLEIFGIFLQLDVLIRAGTAFDREGNNLVSILSKL